MKTSLIIDDQVFKEAKKEALKSGKTVSELISLWAQFGRIIWKEKSTKSKSCKFEAIDLGIMKMELSSRKNWMEDLDNDRD